MIRKVKLFKQGIPNVGMLERLAEQTPVHTGSDAEIEELLSDEEIYQLNQAMILVEFISKKIVKSNNRAMASRFLANTDAVTVDLEKHFKIGRFNPNKNK